MPPNSKKEALIAKLVEDLERHFRDQTLAFIRESLSAAIGASPATAAKAPKAKRRGRGRPKKAAAPTAPKKAAAKKTQRGRPKGSKTKAGKAKKTTAPPASQPAAVLALASDGGSR